MRSDYYALLSCSRNGSSARGIAEVVGGGIAAANENIALVWDEVAENIARGDADFAAARYETYSTAEKHAVGLRRIVDQVIGRRQRKARPN
ncbi:hypothetical protein [Paracraurococcus lichenis]|uniref:Uncharacterized protein n=1 Tax=Paracraurococcus lichenis TaxID=3064888 RepID=A0ABT9ECX7_9PROT|nr:hypothetical protein [Paracraurococcus sp. LOR1-02]MDO9714081.1 hypothetical protein [Paracraurococcus sp. LOR1-02]